MGPGLDDDNGTDSGSAYLFDITTGEQIAKLLPDDGAAYDSFGFSVAISGSTAITGAYDDDDNGSNSGSAYLFDAECCFADLDCSGDVDFGDIIAVLDAWDNEGGPEDLDDSGVVDFEDLRIVLDSWGAVPGRRMLSVRRDLHRGVGDGMR